MATEITTQLDANRLQAEEKRRNRRYAIRLAKEFFPGHENLQLFIDIISGKRPPTKDEQYRPPVA
jgi:hypothetical protein